jgi:hypothetical protein
VSGVLVDSNVILDLVTKDPVWLTWSLEQFEHAAEHGRVIINPIIYGEVSVSFASIDDLETFLPSSILRREGVPFEAAFLAGKAFAAYRKRGELRGSLLPDFLIGAHAAVRGYRILTRDDRRYHAYFPSVRLITPKMKN